jgi:peptidoglycan/LPS O-acetylase OafA/YrhL
MKPTQNPTSSTQWAILAALRFFLATVVVLGHFSILVRSDHSGIVGLGYLHALSAVFGFFIISGFSIAASLDRENTGFYRRRVARVWPLYLSAIAFALVLRTFVLPGGFTWPQGGVTPHPSALPLIASLLMLQTIIAHPIPFLGPIWSLAGEWWHYMIAPVLKRLNTAALLAWIAISFIFFLRLHAPGPGVGCMDGFTHGEAVLGLSWVWVSGFLYYRFRGTSSGFVLLMVPSLFALTIEHSPGVPMFIAILVLILSEGHVFPKKSIAFLNFLGDWSYPIYLFHIPALILAIAIGVNRSIAQLGVAFLVPLLALYVIDYPSRSLFRRKAPALASTVGTTTG